MPRPVYIARFVGPSGGRGGVRVWSSLAGSRPGVSEVRSGIGRPRWAGRGEGQSDGSDAAAVPDVDHGELPHGSWSGVPVVRHEITLESDGSVSTPHDLAA